MPDVTQYTVARPPLLVLSAIGTTLERHHHAQLNIGSDGTAFHAAGAGRQPMKPETDSPGRADPAQPDRKEKPDGNPNGDTELPEPGSQPEIPDKPGEDPDSRPPARM